MRCGCLIKKVIDAQDDVPRALNRVCQLMIIIVGRFNFVEIGEKSPIL